jgi:hypothetical protein
MLSFLTDNACSNLPQQPLQDSKVLIDAVLREVAPGKKEYIDEQD